MWPATLGMTYAILPPERKGLAGGLILGVISLGNAAGPLIGGLLTDVLDWRPGTAASVRSDVPQGLAVQRPNSVVF